MAQTPGSSSARDTADRFKLRRSIVIGLGGTGRHVCTQLKGVLLSAFDNDPARFAHVRFLSIDTDARVKKILTHTGDTVQLGREEVLGVRIPTALNTKRLRRIMSDSVMRHLSHANQQGAMRSRPIGHAFLVTNWMPIRERIKALIRDLRSADLRNMVRTDPRFQGLGFDATKIDLYVVGNLVSGTGSGMALGMGYLLRDLLAEIYDGVTEFRTEGIFTVCGIYALGDGGGGQPSPYAVNCYAALLEFNHFTNPIIHKNPETSYDPGYEAVRVDGKARLQAPFDNVQLLNPSHSAAGELSHEAFEPHIAEVLALRTGSAIGMTGNAKVIDELSSWPRYDNNGNLRFCWAWGAHSFRSSSQEILDLATALAADQVLDALTGENVRTAMNRKEAAWALSSSVGFGYAGDQDKARKKNSSLLTELLTPKEPIQNLPVGVSVTEAIREIINKAFPQPPNERDFIEGLPIQLDRRKHELASRITGLITTVAEHNRRLQALSARDAFEKELFKLADFSVDGRGCLDDAIGVIDLLIGGRRDGQDGARGGLLMKDSAAYQAAAQTAMGEIQRGRTLVESNEASIKSIAAMGRRFDYQALIGAWGTFVKGMVQEKVNEAKKVVLGEARKILDGDRSDQNEVLRNGLIRHLDSLRGKLRTARHQLKSLDERFENRIDRLERLLRRPGAEESKMLEEAHELKNKALKGEALRLCAEEVVEIIGPPYTVQNRFDTPDQMDQDYAAIDAEMRDRIQRVGADQLTASIESNPDFDGRLQSLLERSEPSIRINPNEDAPPEIAYLSVPPNVPTFKQEVVHSNWLGERIKNKNVDELFQERADDSEPRVDVIMALLNFSPASIIGIDKWAELYGRVATNADGRRRVHIVPDDAGGESLFFEDLGQTDVRLTLAYLVGRSQKWLVEDEVGSHYRYPRAEGSLLEESERRDFQKPLGDPDFLDEIVSPLAANAQDSVFSVPVFVHVLRRFRDAMLGDDETARDLAFSSLIIGVAQVAKRQGELNTDPLLPKPSRPSDFAVFEQGLRHMLAPLGISNDLFRRVKALQDVPELGGVAALADDVPQQPRVKAPPSPRIEEADEFMDSIEDSPTLACPNGHPVPDGARFCTQCGEKIQASTSKIFCVKCGKELAPDGKFCDQCGTAVES